MDGAWLARMRWRRRRRLVVADVRPRDRRSTGCSLHALPLAGYDPDLGRRDPRRDGRQRARGAAALAPARRARAPSCAPRHAGRSSPATTPARSRSCSVSAGDARDRPRAPPDGRRPAARARRRGHARRGLHRRPRSRPSSASTSPTPTRTRSRPGAVYRTCVPNRAGTAHLLRGREDPALPLARSVVTRPATEPNSIFFEGTN